MAGSAAAWATKWSPLYSTAIPPLSRSSVTEGPRPSHWSSKPSRQREPRAPDSRQLAERHSDDPFAHNALDDLARAPTVPTAEILLDQAEGVLCRELVLLGQSITDEPDRALAQIARLIGHARVGLRLLDGWRVVIAGRPNVGKSRLFNALVGYTRAIVDPTPGTTRDVVSVRAVFGGWPVNLADTAGLRST